MAKTTTVYNWDNTEAYSDNFSISTRYYDLGDASLLKTIYQISLTTGLKAGQYDGGSPIVVDVYYRTSTNGSWGHYAIFSATNVGTYLSNFNSKTITKKKKLKKIPGIQLKITATVPESFFINDISIEYRHLRRKAVGRPE